jgi:hypothetical protein
VTAAQITPGPWMVLEDEPTQQVRTADNLVIADVRNPCNVRAIAAVPAMVGALREARLLIGCHGQERDGITEAERQGNLNRAWHLLDDALQLAGIEVDGAREAKPDQGDRLSEQDEPAPIVRRAGGWFVARDSWSGPWNCHGAAELARDGRYDEAHALERGHCPGHVASDGDPKLCRYCGTHVDEERP